jgi:membrane protease YdiL (CAAX protease family)
MRRLTVAHEVPLKKVQLIEVSVFLFLLVPSMVLSSSAIDTDSLSFPVVAWSGIIQDLALLSLILFFVWRNGEPFHLIGWTVHQAGREVILGIGLTLPVIFSIGLLEKALRRAGFSILQSPPSYLTPSGASEFLLALIFLVVVAVSEEAIFRGYLILRFKAFLGGPAAALLFSSALFSIGHGYQKAGGVIAVGILGMVLGLVYLWRGSLVPPVTIHFFQDFIGIILVPLGIIE